jgi:hypothetical protein
MSDYKDFYKEISSSTALVNKSPIIKFDDIAKRMHYRNNLRSYANLHNGQRKLFISELQFLTNIYDKLDSSKTYYVVYAGAAPAHHTYFLSTFFTNIKYILIDPAKFELMLDRDLCHTDLPFGTRGYKYLYSKYNKQFESEPPHTWIDIIKNSNNGIFLIENYMSDEYAKLFKELSPIFISDIRTNEKDSESPTDLDLLWNSAMQYNWACIMQPIACMFKFRIPFFACRDLGNLEQYHMDAFNTAKSYGINFVEDHKKNIFRYLDGDIYIQAFPGIESCESRLCLFGALKTKEYDCREYEQKFYYYNVIERNFIHHINKYSNAELYFDHCNDCAIEAIVWENYSINIRKIDIYQCIRTLNIILNRTLKMSVHGRFFLPNCERIKDIFNFKFLNWANIQFAATPKFKQISSQRAKFTFGEICKNMVMKIPKKLQPGTIKIIEKSFVNSPLKLDLWQIKNKYPLLHQVRFFKPIAITRELRHRSQFLYLLRYILTSRLKYLIIIDSITIEKYLGFLCKLVPISVIQFKKDSNNKFSNVPHVAGFYEYNYPTKWADLQRFDTMGKWGIFCPVWNYSEVGRRLLKEEFLGAAARIYCIIKEAAPHSYLLGFEPHIDTFEFNKNAFSKMLPLMNLAKKIGYDPMIFYNKGIYLFFAGDPWIIPYGPNKAFKTLIYSECRAINREADNFSPPLEKYNIADYCEKHMYYNMFDRGLNLHPNKYANKEKHYDYCNDCAQDAYILSMYCEIYKRTFWEIWEFVTKLFDCNLFSNGHGLLFEKNKELLVDMYQYESAIINNTRYSLIY